MSIYNCKHCVFEQVGVDNSQFKINGSAITDSDGAYNNWNISIIRNTTLPERLLLLSSVLQDNLTNTTIQTATNGTNGTLVSTSDKLFLGANKEFGKTSYSRTEENNALTTWSYWVSHTLANEHIKYDTTNTASEYWTRSPANNNKTNMLYVNSSGNFNVATANDIKNISLCFAF